MAYVYEIKWRLHLVQLPTFGLREHLMVKIRKTPHSMPLYLYNALQIQPQIFVQITSNSYAAQLKKTYKFLFFRLRLVTSALVRFDYV